MHSTSRGTIPMESRPTEPCESVRLALQAMATRFEVLLYGPRASALRAAAEDALAEVARLEARLSLYRPDSDIARLNRARAEQPVRLLPEVWQLLRRARDLSEATEGAFDITVAPLLECWGFLTGIGRRPSPEAVADALERVGSRYLELDASTWTARLLRAGMKVDLGGIGKGYAIEQAVEVLRQAGITSALIHGGTSSVYGLGSPPDMPAWQVAVEPPPELRRTNTAPLAVVTLQNRALSVSAVWGRAFADAEGLVGHVLDPRTGRPVAGTVLAATVTASPTDADALSTALLVLGENGLKRLKSRWPDLQALVLSRHEGTWRLASLDLETTWQPPPAAPDPDESGR